jgi:hypothetical protein
MKEEKGKGRLLAVESLLLLFCSTTYNSNSYNTLFFLFFLLLLLLFLLFRPFVREHKRARLAGTSEHLLVEKYSFSIVDK